MTVNRRRGPTMAACLKCGSWTVHSAGCGREDEIRGAVEAGNSQYWNDAREKKSQGSIIDYITRAVMSALANH